MKVIKVTHIIEPGLNIHGKDSLYKNHHDDFHELRLREDLLIELENELIEFVSNKVEEYLKYWTTTILEDYKVDTNKVQFLEDWKKKVNMSMVENSGFSGNPGSLWGGVVYGNNLYGLNRLIEKQKSDKYLLASWSIEDIIATKTLIKIKQIVNNLDNSKTSQNFTSKSKTLQNLTFKWIGEKPIEEAHKIINGKVFNIDLETFIILFSEEPIELIKSKISLSTSHTLGEISLFFDKLDDAKLISNYKMTTLCKILDKDYNSVKNQKSKLLKNKINNKPAAVLAWDSLEDIIKEINPKVT